MQHGAGAESSGPEPERMVLTLRYLPVGTAAHRQNARHLQMRDKYGLVGKPLVCSHVFLLLRRTLCKSAKPKMQRTASLLEGPTRGNRLFSESFIIPEACSVLLMLWHYSNSIVSTLSSPSVFKFAPPSSSSRASIAHTWYSSLVICRG